MPGLHGETWSTTPIKEAIKHLLDIVLKYNIFRFHDTCYKQIQGTAMGTKMAPAHTGIYMASLEGPFLESLRAHIKTREQETIRLKKHTALHHKRIVNIFMVTSWKAPYLNPEHTNQRTLFK